MPRRLGKNPELYNIPAHLSFVDELATGILKRYGENTLELSEVLILLPNRRAVRSLRDAFLRLSGGKSIILPSMQPIGDVDEDGLVMGGNNLHENLALKPAISAYSRQMLLMNIIHSWHMKKGGDIPESAGCAVLAEALGHLLDQVQTEDLSFSDLEKIVPEEYSIHWQDTLDFLKILTEHWPNILDATGYMDAAERRNMLLLGLRELWLENPPTHPIIAAGSTGSVKATSALLEVIARLPNGMIVLPGLDIALDDESWDAIEDTHPQATMKNLMQVIQVDRPEVQGWNKDIDQNHLKTRVFREIMRPAETSGLWQNIDDDICDALNTVKQIVAPGVREEAGAIALMMREQLENPGKTAALVTPDRMLARQVAGELQRWGIEIDDSAGIPLFNTAPGIYLRLVAEMVAENLSPIQLLSALKHPFMAGGMDVGDFRKMVRTLEKRHLRGPRPDKGAAGITRLIEKDTTSDDVLLIWWDGFCNIIKPLIELMAKDEVSFGELLQQHIEVAEKLASTNNEFGAKVLWRGDAGEAAAKLVEDLQVASPNLYPIKPDQYASLFDQFMRNVTVRAKYGQHPRLNIWGPLEARLQHADLMILSGLNEGVWPPEIAADPWMSRPMRKDFGLPGLEQKIGLSAHDFVQTASAKNVILTRAAKVDSTPTVKSRWLSRLHAISIEAGIVENANAFLSWYSKMDKPKKEVPNPPPAPAPPLSARPRQLSVTAIQTWMQDPYSLYARKILRLKKLDDLDQDPGALDKGIIIHDILEEFMTEFKDQLPDNSEEELLKIGKKYFSETLDRPIVAAFWWPRFKQIARWFVIEETKRRSEIRTVASETNGELSIDLAGGAFKLTARADRIDQFIGGGYSVIDYKTGNAPSIRELKAGYAPQLPLEALIVSKGGFDLLRSGEVDELSYWKLSGGEPAGEIRKFGMSASGKAKVDISALTSDAYDGLVKLVTTFDLKDTPYLNKPRPDAVGYGEYDHLARTKEWGDG